MAGKEYHGGRKVDLKRYGANHDGINWKRKTGRKQSTSASTSTGIVEELMAIVDEQLPCKASK